MAGRETRRLTSVTLNGTSLDVGRLNDGRLQLTGLQPENELVVAAELKYSADGEGLHRAVDAADGLVYTYAMSSLDAAPRYFACFDQPDLKAPYRMKVTCAEEWLVLGNGAATQVAPGRVGRCRDASRCRRTSSRWSPGRTTCITDSSTTASRSAGLSGSR